MHFPSEVELNPRLSDLLKGRPEETRLTADDYKVLQAWLAGFAAPGAGPVFEELLPNLNDAANKLLDEIRRQYDRQLAVLDATAARGVPATARRAGAIAKNLNAALDSSINQERRAAAVRKSAGLIVPVYDVFPAVRMNINATAGTLERTRLLQYLEATPALGVDPGAMAKAIRADPAPHIAASASEQLFITNFAAAGRPATAKAYAESAQPPDEPAYFEKLIAANATIAAAYTNRLTAEVRRQLPAVRRAVAAEQFQTYFGGLAANKPLADEALARLQNTGGAAVSSLPEAVSLLRSGGYDGLSRPERLKLLEETARQVLDLANQRFKEGYQAVVSQLALLRKIEQERLEQLKKDVERKRPEKEILREWQADLEKRWQAQVGLPTEALAQAGSSPTVYTELLAITRKQLNKDVRQLYNAIKSAPTASIQIAGLDTEGAVEKEPNKTREIRQDVAQPEDQHDRKSKSDQENQAAKPKSEKSSSAATAQDTVVARIQSANKIDRKNNPDGVLVLTEAPGGRCQAQLVLDSTNNAGYKVAFTAKDPQASADAIFEAFKPQLDAMLVMVAERWRAEYSGLGIFKRKTPPQLKLFIVIESNEVRHRMSLLLRKRIEEAIQDWTAKRGGGAPAINLSWKVGLTFVPATEEKNRKTGTE